MTVKITQYKWLGKWGPFRIKTPSEECDLTTGILKDMMNREFNGKNIVFEKKPWLDNWIYCLLRGAWHAPIIMVDGKKFHQYSRKHPIFDRKKLTELVSKKLDKRSKK